MLSLLLSPPKDAPPVMDYGVRFFVHFLRFISGPNSASRTRCGCSGVPFLPSGGRLLRRPFLSLMGPKNARRCSQSAFGLVNPVVSKAGNDLRRPFSNFVSGLGSVPRTHCGYSGVRFFPSEGRLPGLPLGAVLFEHVNARMATGKSRKIKFSLIPAHA